MAASKAIIGVLLMSFVVAAAVSAGGEIPGAAKKTLHNHREVNKTTYFVGTRRHRPTPLAAQHDTKTETYGTPLDDIMSHHHQVVAKPHYKGKIIVARPSRSKKVDKQTNSHPTNSGHIRAVSPPGSKKSKLKLTARRIKRVVDKPISAKTSTNTTTPSGINTDRHIVKDGTDSQTGILKTPVTKKKRKHTGQQTETGSDRKPKKNTDKNDTLAKKTPRPSPKKSAHVSVVDEKKLKHTAKSRLVDDEERPLCKPHDATLTTKRPLHEQQVKSHRIIDSYQKAEVPRRDLFTLLGIRRTRTSANKQKQPKQRNNLEIEATLSRNSFPGPLNKNNISEGNWALNRFILKNAHSQMLNKVKRCAECTQKSGIEMFTVGSGAKKKVKTVGEVAGKQCVTPGCGNGTESNPIDQSVEGMMEPPAKVRVKKSVGDFANQDDITVDWSDYGDIVKIAEEKEDHNNIRDCIPSQTFALGLICMSVLLSICFMILWRRTDQPEKMYALAYVIACIVYVILALVYLGTRSAYYISTVTK